MSKALDRMIKCGSLHPSKTISLIKKAKNRGKFRNQIFTIFRRIQSAFLRQIHNLQKCGDSLSQKHCFQNISLFMIVVIILGILVIVIIASLPPKTSFKLVSSMQINIVFWLASFAVAGARVYHSLQQLDCDLSSWLLPTLGNWIWNIHGTSKTRPLHFLDPWNIDADRSSKFARRSSIWWIPLCDHPF